MAVQIEFTLNAWAMALGIEPKTLAKKLTQSSLPNEGQLCARDVFTALSGEKDASIIRLNNAKADELEQDRKVRDKELVEIPTAERLLWLELLGPLKQEMDLMPEKLAPMLSEDSQRVAVLREWVEETKRKILKEK